MLADVRGLDILDAGCGTGRWLEQLAERSPRSLLGVDISPAMLKWPPASWTTSCDLRLGSCTALPVRDASADMVLSSFVVSYLDDLESFAQRDRSGCPPGSNYLSYRHASGHRGILQLGEMVSGKGFGYSDSRPRMASATDHRAFRSSRVQACFAHGAKLQYRREADLRTMRPARICITPPPTLPAIYVLQLRKSTSSPRRSESPQGATTDRSVCMEPALRGDRMQPSSGFCFDRGWDDSFSPERVFGE